MHNRMNQEMVVTNLGWELKTQVLQNKELSGATPVVPKARKVAAPNVGEARQQKCAGGNGVSEEAMEALARCGKAKTCGDEYGCRHNGISEMVKMTRVNFLHYSKKGAWLADKSCIRCKTELPMQMAGVKVGVEIIYCYYCDQGINAAKFDPSSSNPEVRWKHDQYKCDHVLCVECGNARLAEYEGKVGRGRRSRRGRQ